VRTKSQLSSLSNKKNELSIRNPFSTSNNGGGNEKDLKNGEDTEDFPGLTTMPNKKLFMWGTNKNGVIPFDENESSGDPNATTATSGGGTTGGLLNMGGGKVIYEPQEIDVCNAFGIDNKTVTIRNIVCGPSSTAAILSNDTCFHFGENKSGQLGHSDRSNTHTTPQMIDPPVSSSLVFDEISQISPGSNFSAIIDKKGDLYTFGYDGSVLQNGIGCLGLGYLSGDDGDTTSSSSASSGKDANSSYRSMPTLVTSLIEDGVIATQVAVGASHMAVLTDEGEVLTTGAGAYGRCGNLDPIDQLFLEPVELLSSGSEKISQVAAGKDFTLVLDTEGVVSAFGRNHKGQCGTGSGLGVEMYAMEAMPIAVDGMLEGRNVVKIAAGHSHGAAITDVGELFFWGMGVALAPESVSNLGHVKIVDVCCGKDYTIALDSEGHVYSFGNGRTGVLGLGDKQKNSKAPVLIGAFKGMKVTGLSAGWDHVACLVEE